MNWTGSRRRELWKAGSVCLGGGLCPSPTHMQPPFFWPVVGSEYLQNVEPFPDFSICTPPEPNSGVIEALPLLRPELSLSFPFSSSGEKEVPCEYWRILWVRTFGNLRYLQTLDELILLLVLPFQPPALGRVDQ